MALKIPDGKEVADAFKNLILKKGIKAHFCQLTYLFFQNVCHPCYVPWSVFVHGAFEITAPLPDFGCPKLILYWFAIFLGKKKSRHYLLCCSSIFELSFNVLFFLDDIAFLLTSLYFSRFPCRGVCWLCITLSGYLLTLKPICTHVGFSISCSNVDYTCWKPAFDLALEPCFCLYWHVLTLYQMSFFNYLSSLHLWQSYQMTTAYIGIYFSMEIGWWLLMY